MQTLDKILDDFRQMEVSFFFAANSICFNFEDMTKEQVSFSLWCDPFWRFVKEGNLILSSMTCPVYDDYKSKKKYNNDFDAWCDTVKPLKSIPLKIITRKAEINDLMIEWVDGTILEVYQDNNKQGTWYVHNKGLEKYYEALPMKILEENEKN